jgi:hypothetical protein
LAFWFVSGGLTLNEIGERDKVAEPYRPGPFIAGMGLADTDYAVLTSDRELNKLGCGRVNEARVLFTTQQRLERRGAKQSFAEMSDLYFHGRPRQIRVWDEAILPGKAITVNLKDMLALLRPLNDAHAGLADAIRTAHDDLEHVKDGGLYRMSDFAGAFDLTLNGVTKVLARARQIQVAPIDASTLIALWELSDKVVSVRRDNPHGNTILDYCETLPRGLAPLVVLDASGRVRETYAQWAKRGGLVTLPSAPKSYKNLTVYHWGIGGGKNSFRERGATLLDGIALAINAKPSEDWLVVYHKDGIGLDFKAEVRDRITGDKKRVEFLNWGQHQATNKFRNVPNVILAGTLFYPVSYYEALTRLAADLRPVQGPVDPNLVKAIELGEHKHLVLQALCRASVRGCKNGVCTPCNAYLIASTRSGIPKVLDDIFPGCETKDWKPVDKPLRGRPKQAADYVIRWFEKNPNDLLRFNVVQRALGMSGTSNFRNLVRLDRDFIQTIKAHGIAEADGRRGFLKPFVEAL